jgi:hypothetical protein
MNCVNLPAAAAESPAVGRRVTTKESAMARRIGLVVAGGGIAVVAGVVGAALPVRSNADSMGLQVKFENDRVRVLELHLKPGEREGQRDEQPPPISIGGAVTLAFTMGRGARDSRSRARHAPPRRYRSARERRAAVTCPRARPAEPRVV